MSVKKLIPAVQIPFGDESIDLKFNMMTLAKIQEDLGVESITDLIARMGNFDARMLASSIVIGCGIPAEKLSDIEISIPEQFELVATAFNRAMFGQDDIPEEKKVENLPAI